MTTTTEDAQAAAKDAGLAAAGPRQWTLEDVENSTPPQTLAAMNAGLLRDLGAGPRRKRR
jgi:hypothetical protein